MSFSEGERIESYCRIIWGEGNYDIDVECDDASYPKYIGVIKRDFGLVLGPPLTVTQVCDSSEQACRELDRMQVQSGQPMTKDQTLDIFGGPERS